MGARRAAVIAVAAAALAIVGCGGGGASPSATGAVLQVSGDDNFRFSPSEFRVPAGRQVTVEFANTGQALLHDFSTRGQTRNVSLVAAPGAKRRGSFTTAGPGRYEFFCGQAGHEPAGMKGTLIVE